MVSYCVLSWLYYNVSTVHGNNLANLQVIILQPFDLNVLLWKLDFIAPD